MKLVDRFKEFLENTVNLNQTRINLLESRVETIKSFLRDSDYKPRIKGFSAQGSWAHKTIIKPVSEESGFDADIVIYLYPEKNWKPADYIVELRRVFWESSTYGEMVSYKTRCVKIDYAGDFHLDIVPIIVEEVGSGTAQYNVCNRLDNVFEVSDGDGFAAWWLGQNAITSAHHLIKVARLLKYLRDYKGTFVAKSVLLTTMIGQRITPNDQMYDAPFADVPTTLKTVVARLDDWLQENPTMPRVENPVLPTESFTRKWTQDHYSNFRQRMHQYREWIDDAFGEQDKEESIKKWRRVFGDEFASDAAVKSASVMKRMAESFANTVVDWAERVFKLGPQVIDQMPTLPYVEAPKFPQLGGPLALQIRIVATANGAEIQSRNVVEKGKELIFKVVTHVGMPIPRQFIVHWQVVNTGPDAEKAKSLRGTFYQSTGFAFRRERTLYRGVHWVQAFVTNGRNGALAGVSDKFFVVIP